MRPVALAILVGLSLGSSAPAQAPDTGTSFIERFDSLDDQRWIISDGWANADWQGCIFSAANARLTPQGLELHLAPGEHTARAYACAELQTRAFYGYGAYEVRMRAARNPGIVSAFFTYTGPQQGNPHDEIDFEFLGRDTTQVQLNYFARGDAGGARLMPLGFDAARDMGDYAFIWRPGSISWYINGAFVHERRASQAAFPLHPGKIMLSLWNGVGLEQWLGRFSYPGRPLIAQYEHVAFTRLGEPCQFAGSIVCALSERGAW
jgi:endo-1,3-1,4-beta-glycanase ExoK